MAGTAIIWVLMLATNFSVTPHTGGAVGAFVNESACSRSAARMNATVSTPSARWECQRIELVVKSPHAGKTAPQWMAVP
jgi:hypothetical protein